MIVWDIANTMNDRTQDETDALCDEHMNGLLLPREDGCLATLNFRQA